MTPFSSNLSVYFNIWTNHTLAFLTGCHVCSRVTEISTIHFGSEILARLYMRWLRRVLIKTSSKESRILLKRRGICFSTISEYRYQLVCRWHIDLFSSEWVTNLHILNPNNVVSTLRVSTTKKRESQRSEYNLSYEKAVKNLSLNCVGCLLTTPSKVRVLTSTSYLKSL